MTSTISTSQTLIMEKEEKKKKKTGPCHSLQLTRLYLFLGKLILYRPRMAQLPHLDVLTLPNSWMHFCLPWRKELQGLLQNPLIWQYFPKFRSTEIFLFGSGQQWVEWIICMGLEVAGICQLTYFTYLSQLDYESICLTWCQSIGLSWLFFISGSI